MNSAENRPDPGQSTDSSAQHFTPEGERMYKSEALFGDQLEITICHNGECYRLRKTKTGKLILNK